MYVHRGEGNGKTGDQGVMGEHDVETSAYRIWRGYTYFIQSQRAEAESDE
jgi:hypothetical protein